MWVFMKISSNHDTGQTWAQYEGGAQHRDVRAFFRKQQANITLEVAIYENKRVRGWVGSWIHGKGLLLENKAT